jgi:hypothetical protein
VTLNDLPASIRALLADPDVDEILSGNDDQDITEISCDKLRERAEVLTYNLKNGHAFNDEFQAGLISEILTEEVSRY